MTELLTAAQMRAIEAAAIASGSVTGLELMERAGRGVVDAIFAEWPELQAGSFRAVVLCGPGNNGGDGFVVARLLKEWGWGVEVFLYGTPDRMPPDARVNYERWLAMGVVHLVAGASSWQDVLAHLARHRDQVLIDALFGTGLTRPLVDPVSSLLFHLDDVMDLNIGTYVAIDIPSGICACSGRLLTRRPRRADLTVTFHSAKLGHYLQDGPYYAGRLLVADIGLAALPQSGRVSRIEAPHPVLGKRGDGYKFAHGHALIFSGGVGQGGAARMAARASLRIGAGLVTLACPPAALIENAAQLNAIMLRSVTPETLAAVLEDSRINALCIGPGLGVDRAAGLLPVAVRAKHAPYIVLDADALTALSRDAGLFAMLNDRCVLTPHAGEFARLFPDIAARLEAPALTGPAYSKVDATCDAAARARCVVLFKGPDTVIADPSGRCSINSAAYDRAAPWLATAGSGDVLAGFICGLLARGFAPMQAAETAAWLHVECARSFGPGLIAEDLPDELPKVLRALGL